MLIFFALFIAGSELLESWWPNAAPTGELQALPVLGRELLQLLLVVVATLVLGVFERRTLGDYGLPLVLDRRALRGFGLGFVAASALLLALAGLRVMHFSVAAQSEVALASHATQWALVFLVVALFEELFMRGYAQATLARSIGFWPAGILLSIVFALVHVRNPGETPLGLIAVGCFGLFFCVTLYATGNLWMPGLLQHCCAPLERAQRRGPLASESTQRDHSGDDPRRTRRRREQQPSVQAQSPAGDIQTLRCPRATRPPS